MKALTIGLLFLLVCNLNAYSEVVLLASNDWQNLALVTHFQQWHERHDRLTVKVAEVDSSATEALNPVSLFIAISNDDPSRWQAGVWKCPFDVDSVEQIAPTHGGFRVYAKRGRLAGDGRIARRNVVLTVRYGYRAGKLSKSIDVALKEP